MSTTHTADMVAAQRALSDAATTGDVDAMQAAQARLSTIHFLTMEGYLDAGDHFLTLARSQADGTPGDYEVAAQLATIAQACYAAHQAHGTAHAARRAEQLQERTEKRVDDLLALASATGGVL